MKFEKYHALGNDYLVYDPQGGDHQFNEHEIVRICHRNFGLGSDGILVGPLQSEKQTSACVFSIPMEARRKKVETVCGYLPSICLINKK